MRDIAFCEEVTQAMKAALERLEILGANRVFLDRPTALGREEAPALFMYESALEKPGADGRSYALTVDVELVSFAADTSRVRRFELLKALHDALLADRTLGLPGCICSFNGAKFMVAATAAEASSVLSSFLVTWRGNLQEA